MENQNYSRYRRRNYRVREQDEGVTYKHVVIMQSVVCLVLLGFILLIGFIKVPYILKGREALKNTLSRTTSLEKVVEVTENTIIFLKEVKDNVKDTIITTFDSDKKGNLNNIGSNNNTVNESENRIDEDILREMEQKVEFMELEVKK